MNPTFLPIVSETSPASAQTALTPQDPQPPSFEAILDNLRSWTGNAESYGSSCRYSCGVSVNLLKNEAAYGAGAVERAAAELLRDADSLYSWGRVAATWSWQDFQELAKRPGSRGIPLTFSHFVVLAKLEDGQRRQALLEAALAEQLSVRDLSAMLRKPSKARVDRRSEERSEEGERAAPPDLLESIGSLASDYIDRSNRLEYEITQWRSTGDQHELAKRLRDSAVAQKDLANKASANAEMLARLAEEAERGAAIPETYRKSEAPASKKRSTRVRAIKEGTSLPAR